MSDTVRSAQFEDIFKDWNLPFELIDSVEIDSIGRDPVAQVRQIANIAIPANVEDYAFRMKNGAKFPPIVIWADQNILLDGNTRLAAAKKLGRSTFPAYKVSIPFLDMAKALAATLQDLAGQKLAPAERRTAALTMIQLGFTDANIAMSLGITAESARQWRRLEEVADRAERTGTAEQVARMNKTNRLTLSKINHDQPFRELVMAVADGKPEVKDVREVVEAVAAATSDDAALALIASAREEWVPIGPEPKQTRRNMKAQQARMHVGGLLKLDPTEIVEQPKAAEDLVRWRDLLDMAQRVVSMLTMQGAA